MAIPKLTRLLARPVRTALVIRSSRKNEKATFKNLCASDYVPYSRRIQGSKADLPFVLKEMQQLTIYYGNAIRYNFDSVTGMETAIWATF